MKIFVPGRICLLGEHSDWAAGYRRVNPQIERGYAVIVGTNQGLYADVRPHPTHLVITSTTPDGDRHGPYEIPMEAGALLEEAERGGFFSYSAGVAYHILTQYHVRGLVIDNYHTDLPIKKGLSSSAAVCVLTARAFNRIYDLKLTVRGEMELAYNGEILTPSQCGRLDQGCAFGSRPVMMTFDGDRLHTTELNLPDDLYLVIVDLCAQKNTHRILADLNRCYPYAESATAQGVQQLLGPENQRIVHEALDALRVADAQRLGALMTEAQALFNRYAAPACPEELTAPVLNRVLNYEPLKPYTWGGKGVGSQGDGAAQFVARSEADQQTVVEIIERDLGMPCLKLTLFAGNRVRKALIPAAGFGSTLFPASKATQKELFPIIDRDGIAKPAILYSVEEALAAGIEEVIVIVQQENLTAFQAFFNAQVTLENFAKLAPQFQDYAQRLLDIGQRVHFVIQHNQEGLGHAVFAARERIGSEPFLLMLGDHLYRSNIDRSCAQQLVEAFNRHGQSVVGLRQTPEALVGKFGAVTGNWLDEQKMLSITEFAEKPTVEYARRKLQAPDLPPGEYLTLFGQYIIKPQVFQYLEEHIANNIRERGEFQLTPALERVRREDGFLGLMVDGRRFDLGQPEHYLETMQAFRYS